MCIFCDTPGKSLEGITKINCSLCRIITEIELPKTLIILDCAHCINLKSFKNGLPKTLKFLNCAGCINLENFPILPESLESLRCYYCKFTSLPKLPDTLRELFFTDNENIVSLPVLPAYLRSLICSKCPKLISLPSLPDFLETLICGHLPITVLPRLPNSLSRLVCNNCLGLISLPDLSASLRYLDCSGNNIKKLPILPDVNWALHCYKCPILTSLPTLPASLTELHCYNTWLPIISIGNPNPYYPENIRKLKIIQRMFRKHYLRHKFTIRIILKKYTIIPMAIIDSICREYI